MMPWTSILSWNMTKLGAEWPVVPWTQWLLAELTKKPEDPFHALTNVQLGVMVFVGVVGLILSKLCGLF